MIQQHRMVNKVRSIKCRAIHHIAKSVDIHMLFSTLNVILFLPWKVMEVEREDIHAVTLKTMTPEKYEKAKLQAAAETEA